MSEEVGVQAEQANHRCLASLVHIGERLLPELFRVAWESAQGVSWTNDEAAGLLFLSKYPAVKLNKMQRPLVSAGVLEKWDVSLFAAVLGFSNLLTSLPDKLRAVKTLSNTRNVVAHATNGRIEDSFFESLWKDCEEAIVSHLGGSEAEVQKLLHGKLDATRDVLDTLQCDEKAETSAVQAKEAGNRCFRSLQYCEAEQHYSKALQLQAVLPSQLVAELYSNRSACFLMRLSIESSASNLLDQARMDAERAVKFAPSWYKAHLRLAYAFHKAQAWEEACREYDTARSALQLLLTCPPSGTNLQSKQMELEDIDTKCSECRHNASRARRREHLNLMYTPTFEGAAHEAIKAAVGLPADVRPDKLLTKVRSFMQQSISPELRGNGYVMLGHEAARQSRPQDAAQQFLIAATQYDNPEGMYNLAVHYTNGWGLPRDLKEALTWARRASEHPLQHESVSKMTPGLVGISFAHNMLGNFYAEGIVVRADSVKALEHYKRSADLDASCGLNNYGLCLWKGQHTCPVNRAQAREFFLLSAEQLCSEAMLNLSDLYASIGDISNAIRWSETALRYGALTANERLPKLRKLASKMEAPLPPPVVNLCDQLRPGPASTPQREHSTPSLAALQQFPSTPYLDSLIKAKRVFVWCHQVLTSDPRNIDMALLLKVVQAAAEAMRTVPDAELVLHPMETALLFNAGTLLKDMLDFSPGGDQDRDIRCVTLPHPTIDIKATILSLRECVKLFPREVYFSSMLSCMLAFETAGPLHDFRAALTEARRAFSLLPDVAHEIRQRWTICILYSMAVFAFQSEDPSAADLFQEYLHAAKAHGHRKEALAHYQLGVLLMRKKRRKIKRAALLREMRDHLDVGDRLMQSLPPFLQNLNFPHRNILALALDIPNMELSMQEANSLKPPLFGGEVIPGRRQPVVIRLCEIEGERLRRWRTFQLSMLQALNENGHAETPKHTTLVPPRSSTGDPNIGALTPATVEELFATMTDQVHSGRVLELIVIGVPINMVSYEVLAEDSAREPVRVSIYNLSSTEASQLFPGKRFRVVHPYTRISHDLTVRLCVDDPSNTLSILDTVHRMCWWCLRIETPDQHSLVSCSHCHVGLYCGKTCQQRDWKHHKLWCANQHK